MNSKKIAIITRTKNRNLLLKRAIKSVLSQDYENWVHVIVNDGGDANEVSNLLESFNEQYKGRLVVIHNPLSVGMEAASNIGIKSSQSDYIVIHDDDDAWESTFLSSMTVFLTSPENSMYRGVVCLSTVVNEQILNDQVIEIKREIHNDRLKHSISVVEIVKENQFPPISFMFERAVIDEIGGYDEMLPVLGDWEFNIRFINRFDISVLPQVLSFYHLRPKISSGQFSNTLFSGSGQHNKFYRILQNRFIRGNNPHYQNIKLLANVSYATKESEDNIKILSHTFNRITGLIPAWLKKLM